MGDRGWRPSQPGQVPIQDLMNRPILTDDLGSAIETGTAAQRSDQDAAQWPIQETAEQDLLRTAQQATPQAPPLDPRGTAWSAAQQLSHENAQGHREGYAWSHTTGHEAPLPLAHSPLGPAPIQPLYRSLDVAQQHTSSAHAGPSSRSRARVPASGATSDDEADIEDGDDDDDPLHMTSLDAPSKKSQGRKKIKIEYISENRPRQVSFLKRKNGLLKKAHNLSVLTGCNMAVIIFNRDNGKMYEYSNPSADETISRYAGYRGPSERWSGAVRTLDGAKGTSDIPGDEPGLVAAADAAARMASARHADTDAYIHPPPGRRRLHPNVTVPAVTVPIDVIHPPGVATEDSQRHRAGEPVLPPGIAPHREPALAPTVVPELSTTQPNRDLPFLFSASDSAGAGSASRAAATMPTLSPTTPGGPRSSNDFAADLSPNFGRKSVLGRRTLDAEEPDAKRRREDMSPARQSEFTFRHSASPSAPPTSTRTMATTNAASPTALPSASRPASLGLPSVPMPNSLAAVCPSDVPSAPISEPVSYEFPPSVASNPLGIPTVPGSASPGIPIATTPVTPAEGSEGPWHKSPARPVLYDNERFEAIPALPPLVPQLTYATQGTYCPMRKADGQQRSAFEALPGSPDVGLMPLGDFSETAGEQTKSTTN